MDLGLKGKVAIVTGGTQGIGKAAAVVLAREGASVVIAARGRELLDAVAAEIRAAGGQVAAVQADVGVKADCERLIAEALKAFGRIDILVNNAGTSATGEFESVTDEAWQADFDLKLFGAIRLARLAIPEMKKQKGGRIINITNIGAKQPRAKSMPTTVTRAAVRTGPLPKPSGPFDVFGGSDVVKNQPVASYDVKDDGFLITLADGQVWKQTDDDASKNPVRWRDPASSMRDTISQGAMHSFNLVVNDENLHHKVKRIR